MPEPRTGSRRRRAAAFTVPELVLVALVLAAMAVLGLQQGGESLAREGVESAGRRIALGLEQGRLAAVRDGLPCALQLEQNGWRSPEGASLPGCRLPAAGAESGIDSARVRVEHNLPPLVRFSANGLVLDGGTVLISAPGTALQRCLVMALPLGVTRLGRWQQQSCVPDPSL